MKNYQFGIILGHIWLVIFNLTQDENLRLVSLLFIVIWLNIAGISAYVEKF